MKRSLGMMLAVLAFSFLVVGCSKTQKVVVSQGGLTTAYESVGEIEIERSVPTMSLKRGSQQLSEWVTFGHYQRPSQGGYLKGLLDKELVKLAKRRYGADAVINVQYWPDLSSEKFPQGKVYAKGDMVKYRRFPS